MRYDPNLGHRRSIRLKGYDYASPGAYYVTVVTRDRICWFDLPSCRGIVEKEWDSLPRRFPTLRLDAFVVMPNHVHFIVWLGEAHTGASVETQFNCAPRVRVSPIGQRVKVDKMHPTLGRVVRVFKAAITRRMRLSGGTGFAWQRNYYERVVRNERELNAIRQYIRDNPVNWAQDAENPENVG